MAEVKNAKQMPRRYYGLHFCPGVAEYPGGKRLLVLENAIRNMEPTFEGCPVYVDHVDGVDLQHLQEQADGYVVQSFYNATDGKHWAEFLIVSDKGHEAIAKGWRLSNAYVPTRFDKGGEWNCVSYDREILDGQFEHLAIVENPRYDESIILTPEQFKEYNKKHSAELAKVANSSGKKGSRMLKFFKKAELDIEAQITLNSGKVVSIAELVKMANEDTETQPTPMLGGAMNMDKSEEGEEKAKQGHAKERDDAAPQMANLDHHVHVNGKSMPVHELLKQHMDMHKMMNVLAEHHAAMIKDADLDDGEMKAKKDEESEDCTERNEEDGGMKDAMRAEESEDKTERNDDAPPLDPEKVKQFEAGFGGHPPPPPPKPSNSKGHFDRLKNASSMVSSSAHPHEGISGVALGQLRYGRKG